MTLLKRLQARYPAPPLTPDEADAVVALVEGAQRASFELREAQAEAAHGRTANFLYIDQCVERAAGHLFLGLASFTEDKP